MLVKASTADVSTADAMCSHLFVGGFDDTGECALPQEHTLFISVH